MIWKNAELFNVEELVPYRDEYIKPRGVKCEDPEGRKGYLMSRIPDAVRVQCEEGMQCQAFECSNVEIRFNIRSGAARIKLYSPCHAGLATVAEVRYGSFPGVYQFVTSTGKVETIEVSMPEQVEKWKKVADLSGMEFDPSLVRVLLPYNSPSILVDIEGDITPPRPEQVPQMRFLSYGSSITHGLNSSLAKDSYVSRIARSLRVDGYNKGFGGACTIDPAMADYMAGKDVDFLTLELGINVLGWEDGKFADRVGYMLDTIVKKSPAKHIFVTDLFWFFGDYDGDETPDRFRRIVADKARGFDPARVTYIPGKPILTSPDSLCVDMLHPSNRGQGEIADRFTAVIREKMGL